MRFFNIYAGKQQDRPRLFDLKPGKLYTEDSDLREVLSSCKSIAILGLSPKPERESYKVSKFLQDKLKIMKPRGC